MEGCTGDCLKRLSSRMGDCDLVAIDTEIEMVPNARYAGRRSLRLGNGTAP